MYPNIRYQCFGSALVAMQVRTQHFRSMRIRFRIPIQGLYDQNSTKDVRRPSYRRSLQPSKENIQHFKTYFYFYYFSGSFLPFWIRSQPTKMTSRSMRIQKSSMNGTILYTYTVIKCFGPWSGLDPESIRSVNPDPGGQKWPTKKGNFF